MIIILDETKKRYVISLDTKKFRRGIWIGDDTVNWNEFFSVWV